MKHLLAALSALGITVLYGVIIGGELPGFFLSVLFVSLFGVLAFFERKDLETKPVEKFAMILLFVIFAIFIIFGFYLSLNELKGTVTNEYEAEITHISYGTSRISTDNIFFNDPDGNEKSIKYDIPIMSNDEHEFEEGDIIPVQEKLGLFKIPYCVLEGTENTNMAVLALVASGAVLISIFVVVHIVEKKKR